MTHADPKVGGFASMERLEHGPLNIMRTGILNSPDIRGGTYTLTGKITFNGNELELGKNLRYNNSSGLNVVSRTMPMVGYFDPTLWRADLGCTYTALTANADSIDIALTGLPTSNTLDSVAVVWDGGNAARGGSPPATLPTVKVFRRAATAPVASEVQIGSTATDPFTNEATYEAVHYITASSLAHTIDKANNVYYARFTNEGGANAFSGGKILGIQVAVTCTYQSMWES